MPDLRFLRWRTGRKVGRTIYAQRGPDPSDGDILIGLMDTPELAFQAVTGHNAALRERTDEAHVMTGEARARLEAGEVKGGSEEEPPDA